MSSGEKENEDVGESESADDPPPGSPSSKKPRVDANEEKEAFWQRAATYTCERWSAKPERLSPLTCSRFGWSCIKTDVIRCECCKAIIVCQLPLSNQTSKQNLENAVAMVEGKLVSAHHRMCHWGWAPLEENCCLVDEFEEGDDNNRVLEWLTERTRSLADVRPSLAKVAVKCDDEEFESALYEKLGSSLTNTVCESWDAEVDRKVLRLALTGWRSSAPKVDVLRCDWCARSVGLWMFEDPRSDPVKDEVTDRKILNPLDQHRDWCPWVSRVRCGKEVEPAWKTFANRLMRTAQSPPKDESTLSNNLQDSAKDAISSARKLVESWANCKDGAADDELHSEEPPKKPSLSI